MNDDLISREALKKAIELRKKYIDNAPTVNEDILAEDVIKAHENIGYEKGFRDGYAQCVTDNERPQGEWINHRVVYDDGRKEYHTCNKCRAEIIETDYDNYCSCCGADMRKGEEE